MMRAASPTHGLSSCALKQYDIVLLLRVMLLRLESDGLADEFLEFRDRGGFLVENARDDFRRGEHEQFLRLELAHRARDLTENLVRHGFRRFDAAASFAGRTRFAQ